MIALEEVSYRVKDMQLLRGHHRGLRTGPDASDFRTERGGQVYADQADQRRAAAGHGQHPFGGYGPANPVARRAEAPAGTQKLLLLDEPLTFLDVYYQYDLMHKIRRFMADNPGLTVIGVVHDLNIAAKFADRIMLLQDGGVVAHGPAAEVLTAERILQVFRVVVEDRFRIR